MLMDSFTELCFLKGTIPAEKKPEPVKDDRWKRYHRLVWKLTNTQPLHELEGFERRGFTDHHLDHIVSIWDGFKRGISAEEIAHISNLRFIPHTQNMIKGRKSN